jgi:para-nitrobenzyl esterase
LLGDPVAVKRLYPAASDDDATRAYLDIMGDVAFTLPARMWARWDTQAGGRAYLYQFTHVTSLAASAGLGAPHAAEIAYVFNNLDRLKRPFDETDRTLADAMSTYWTAFARTGDPNATGLPEWKPYDAQGEPAIDFGATVKLASHVRQEKLDVLEGLMQKRRQAPAP